MGKRKANTKCNTPGNGSEENDFKSYKKECIITEQPQTLSISQVCASSSSSSSVDTGIHDQLLKAQAALEALESRFAQVVAENKALQKRNKELFFYCPFLFLETMRNNVI